jgi:flagellar L-ring protein precursor FlgH
MLRGWQSAFIFIVVTVLNLGMAAAADAESLWSSEASTGNLFSDVKARRVGDLITISIVENATATNSYQTSTGKGVGMSASTNGIGAANLSPSIGFNNSYKGNETTSRQGALVARITAGVEQVLPNGDLVVVGSRSIVVNDEKQELTIRGVVRPADIGYDNTISSSLVGNAEIRFKGSPDWVKKGGVFANLWEGVKSFFAWLF